MSSDATRRAVHDVLSHGLRGDLAQSAVGVELGSMLQSGLTADISDGAEPGELLLALREACGQQAVAYARVLDLVVLASLEELQVIADFDGGDLARTDVEVPPPAPTSLAAPPTLKPPDGPAEVRGPRRLGSRHGALRRDDRSRVRGQPTTDHSSTSTSTPAS
jgi:hypothetical protein